MAQQCSSEAEWGLQAISKIGQFLKDPVSICEAIMDLTKNLTEIGQPQESKEEK